MGPLRYPHPRGWIVPWTPSLRCTGQAAGSRSAASARALRRGSRRDASPWAFVLDASCREAHATLFARRAHSGDSAQNPNLPSRLLKLCVGCPHSSTFECCWRTLSRRERGPRGLKAGLNRPHMSALLGRRGACALARQCSAVLQQRPVLVSTHSFPRRAAGRTLPTGRRHRAPSMTMPRA